MLSRELGVSQAFLARWYIGGGYMDVSETCGQNNNKDTRQLHFDVPHPLLTYFSHHVTAIYFSPVFTKFEFSRQIFIKSPVSNLTEVPPVGAALIHSDGQTDGQNLANSRSSRTCDRA